MQTNYRKKADIVTAGAFCEQYVASKFPIKLSTNPFDSEKDGIFTEDGPFYKIGELAEIKLANTWFLNGEVTTPYKGPTARNTEKCTSGKAHLLFLNYQTRYMVNGRLHEYAERYWDYIRILRIIDPTKYKIRSAAVWEYGKQTDKVRQSICWNIENNSEVIDSVLNPKLADKLRAYSNATAR